VSSSSFEGPSSPVPAHDVDKINAAFIKFKNMILIGIIKANPTAKPELDITIVVSELHCNTFSFFQSPHKLEIPTPTNLTPKVPHLVEDRPTTPTSSSGGITIMTSTGSIINTVSPGFEAASTNVPPTNSTNSATSNSTNPVVSEKNLSSLIQQAQQASQQPQTAQSSVLLDPTNVYCTESIFRF
jgi:hypothetical protein